jgi:hypothetical protein
MITLDEARDNVGREVAYQIPGGYPPEHGRIVRVKETSRDGYHEDGWVYVLYEGSRHPKATNPKDLRFTGPRED